jgi:hypothetical protein
MTKLTYLLLISAILMLASCRTVRNQVHYVAIKHDSTAFKKFLSEDTGHKKTVTVTDHDSSGTKTIEIEFDKDDFYGGYARVDTADHSAIGGFSGDTSMAHRHFYWVHLTDVDTGGFIINKDGSIHTRARPTKITITETGTKKGKDSTVSEEGHSKKESGESGTHVTDEVKTTDKSKKKTGLTAGATMFLLLAGVSGLFMLFIAWKNRKKKQLLNDAASLITGSKPSTNTKT